MTALRVPLKMGISPFESTELAANRAADLLQKCNSLSHLKQIHAHLFRFGLHQSNFLASFLISLYSSLSSSRYAAQFVFFTVSYPSLILFNQSIKSLSKSPSLCSESLHLYLRMVRSHIKPDNFTYPYLLNSCASLSDLNHGVEIHGRALKSGLCWVVQVANALIDMYGKCGELGCARHVFDEMPHRDIVSYNALLGAHARSGENMDRAQMVFDAIPVRNVISWNAMVVGYVNGGDLDAARVVFNRMPEKNVVTWTTMLVGYTKRGLMDLAKELFDAMPEKTLVCWTAMLSGFAQSGQPNEAVAMFRGMERARVKPDAFTMTALMSALAQIGCPDLADWITTYVEHEGIERNEHVLTTLVDMHAKCGNIQKACQLFDEISQPGVFPYSALITGLASHGHGIRALELFQQMKSNTVEPDYITFVGILTACSHTGLVEDGLRHWESMMNEYNIEPDADHYACLVDMLGRAGRLDQAYHIINSMQLRPHPGALGALLASCRKYDNVEIAEKVANELFKVEPENTGNYVLLSSIYAGRKKWNEAARIRKEMNEKIVAKLPGSSWVESGR